MSSKKHPKQKRAKLSRSADNSKRFQKDWSRLSASGRYDMNLLKEAMLLLVANDQPLPAEYRDHALSGDWEGYRECHIGGDFLLVYEIQTRGGEEKVVFARAGTHSEIFG